MGAIEFAPGLVDVAPQLAALFRTHAAGRLRPALLPVLGFMHLPLRRRRLRAFCADARRECVALRMLRMRLRQRHPGHCGSNPNPRLPVHRNLASTG